MKIETTRFGIIEVADDRVITFPWGIPGFENVKRYVLIDHKDTPFRWLQAVDEPSLAFVVCPPEIIGIQYNIPAEKLEPLEAENQEDAVVMTLISFDREKNIIRFHIRSPLIFSLSNRKAYQWTMDAGEVKKYVNLPEGMEWQDIHVE
ncbi:flagellar assembly protein FliW [Thermodesulforhabdus norvegica]|uniref:Flagellar assembly factor FliW n=1 Tax=Thermodesulforhabdus norvegica TaxID=39841 RepID=A0A1I4W1V6_9BACT|nr:flagellar assembly protein FliW [Thermodesulforhabdus norvegica]SFN07455.1 flagellar assembly factor FliW [Thermodesulforhabdus norvegica]